MLGRRLQGWFSDPSEWWALTQPSLSAPLAFFYATELAINFEASVAMLLSVLRGRAKDVPMMIHHIATLVVIVAAYRFGFVRVGAAVVALHDVTDVPIDGIRIGQMLQFDVLLFPSVALVLSLPLLEPSPNTHSCWRPWGALTSASTSAQRRRPSVPLLTQAAPRLHPGPTHRSVQPQRALAVARRRC